MAQKTSDNKQSNLDPTISRLLDSKVGNTLRSGGQIKAKDLAIADQQALGLNANDTFKLRNEILQQLQDNVHPNVQLTDTNGTPIDRVTGAPMSLPNVQPIPSLAHAVNGVAPNVVQTSVPPTIPAKTGPAETVANQGDVVSGGLPELLNRIMNSIRTPLQQITSASGPAGAVAQALATPPAPIAVDNTTGTQELSPLQRILNPEGLQQTISDVGKAVNKIVPSQTLEQKALETLKAKNPELATQKQDKGLKKYAGSGEFRINGARYKIDNAGRIIKIG